MPCIWHSGIVREKFGASIRDACSKLLLLAGWKLLYFIAGKKFGNAGTGLPSQEIAYKAEGRCPVGQNVPDTSCIVFLHYQSLCSLLEIIF